MVWCKTCGLGGLFWLIPRYSSAGSRKGEVDVREGVGVLVPGSSNQGILVLLIILFLYLLVVVCFFSFRFKPQAYCQWINSWVCSTISRGGPHSYCHLKALAISHNILKYCVVWNQDLFSHSNSCVARKGAIPPPPGVATTMFYHWRAGEGAALPSVSPILQSAMWNMDSESMKSKVFQPNPFQIHRIKIPSVSR